MAAVTMMRTRAERAAVGGVSGPRLTTRKAGASSVSAAVTELKVGPVPSAAACQVTCKAMLARVGLSFHRAAEAVYR